MTHWEKPSKISEGGGGQWGPVGGVSNPTRQFGIFLSSLPPLPNSGLASETGPHWGALAPPPGQASRGLRERL